MRLSVIIPSYNQFKFIEATMKNIVEIKELCREQNVELEIIVFDNCSIKEVQAVFEKHKNSIDILKVEVDNGQYDAINKGLAYVTGEYWTWLNTDDLIDKQGFLKIINYLKSNTVDYIYGDIETIDEHGNSIAKGTSGTITLESLTTKDASISQPGSFFRTEFTKKIGHLSNYRFAFDYEYILRIFKNNGTVVKLDVIVAQFRYYQESKSGSQDARFLMEQLEIAKLYGSSSLSKLGLMLRLRIIKRKLVN
ncbi:MAG: glycosyltransferase [Burkholderiales bacterium]|nr:glycosyltransferase [Bacteroidia bacterium]